MGPVWCMRMNPSNTTYGWMSHEARGSRVTYERLSQVSHMSTWVQWDMRMKQSNTTYDLMSFEARGSSATYKYTIQVSFVSHISARVKCHMLVYESSGVWGWISQILHMNQWVARPVSHVPYMNAWVMGQVSQVPHVNTRFKCVTCHIWMHESSEVRGWISSISHMNK